MTGFEPQTSGIGSDCSTNWATQPLPDVILRAVLLQDTLFRSKFSEHELTNFYATDFHDVIE